MRILKVAAVVAVTPLVLGLGDCGSTAGTATGCVEFSLTVDPVTDLVFPGVVYETGINVEAVVPGFLGPVTLDLRATASAKPEEFLSEWEFDPNPAGLGGSTLRFTIRGGMGVPGRDYALEVAAQSPSGSHTSDSGCRDNIVIRIGDPVATAVCEGPEPVADAYIRGGPFADTPYGASDILLIKGITGGEYARKTYLVFDVPSYSPGHALQLTLRRHTAANPREARLYGVSDDNDWDPATLAEETITWNNAPHNVTASGTAFGNPADGVSLLATFILNNEDPPGTVYQLDISDYVRWHRPPVGDANGLITLLLAHSAEIAGDDGSEFYSREAADACNRPRIVLYDPF